MTNLFKDCINLEYINLRNFIEKSNANTSKIFDGVPDNIIYCINDEEKVPNIMNELKKKKFAINDTKFYYSFIKNCCIFILINFYSSSS